MIPFDTAVLIGRFQPFHLGHAALLAQALETAPKVVVVLGSAGSARNVRNPFTASEREAMIRATLGRDCANRVVFVGQRDVWDAVRWSGEVRRSVEAIAPGRVALVGHHKDRSSDYLALFPGWTYLETGRITSLDATPLRERILSDREASDVLSGLESAVPPAVLEFLEVWMESAWRGELALDAQAIREWEPSLGGESICTVDGVVHSQGQILVYARSSRPGRGLLALPGGFAIAGEAADLASRRLIESRTGVWIPGSPVRELLFSHPSRSQRGRVSTRAFLWEPDWDSNPPTFPGEGSSNSLWIPLDKVAEFESSFFEDHFHILSMLVPSRISTKL